MKLWILNLYTEQSPYCHPHELVISGQAKMIDESYVDIDDFNVPALFEIQDISPSAYLTCMCNLFWQVGMVILVDIQQLQVILLILISCNLMGHGRPLISINVVIHVTFLRKTLFKRYQLVLYLLGEPTRKIVRITKN